VINEAGTGATLTFDSAPGARYTIEGSASLGGSAQDWSEARDNVASQGTTTTANITLPAGPPASYFYRVVREND
jgi:hypothetical protein